MGKRRSWFAAIKKFFTPHSKEKLGNDLDSKRTKEQKKKGIGRLRHGESNSFLPMFREPSSIEKILGEAEREHQLVFRPPSPTERPKTPPFVSPAPIPASPRASSQRVASPEVVSPPVRVPSPTTTSPYGLIPSPRAASPPVRVRSSRAASPPARIPSPRAASPPARALSSRAASPPAQVRSARAASPPVRVRSSRAASPPGRIPSPRAASPPARARSSRPASPPAQVRSARAASPLPRAASPSPRTASPRNSGHYLPEPTLPIHHASATKVQAAYRGYMARKSFRALKRLVRLQGVIRGQHVKRQTSSAMKYMQLLVRVQSQIQSRRIQMLENQARLAQYQSEKEAESTLSKWTFTQSEAGNFDIWDDSLLTKEEVETRTRRKVEAAVKRERAMAYAHSQQLQKANSKSSQTMVSDIRSGGFPWWWSWLERQMPSEGRGAKNIQFTPPRLASERKSSPKPPSSTGRQYHLGFDNIDASTPKSSRSCIVPSAKPPLSYRTAQASSSSLSKYSLRRRASGGDSPFSLGVKDDDSLMSCPPFSAPNYMSPTVSARAKVRASSNPKDRSLPGTPGSESSKRRLSFLFSQGIGSFKLDSQSQRGSLSSGNKDPISEKVLDRRQSLQSMGNLSVNSTASMPATVGRKPFNRFV